MTAPPSAAVIAERIVNQITQIRFHFGSYQKICKPVAIYCLCDGAQYQSSSNMITLFSMSNEKQEYVLPLHVQHAVPNTEHVGVPTDCKTQCESSCAGMPAVKAGVCWGLVWQVSGPEG